MEAIVLILILVLLSASSKKKKADTAAKAGRAAVQAAAPALRKAQDELKARRAQTQAELKARKAQALAELKAKRAADKKAADIIAASERSQEAFQGVSASDEEGCLGGSMPHDHAEGESREEHARHIAAVDAFDATLQKEREAEAEAARLKARQLRQAVVFAEILDKPRALRPWRSGGSRA